MTRRQASEPSPDPASRADGAVALEVLEALPDPLLVCDAALRVRVLNAGARQLLGLEPMPSAGIGLGDLLAGSQRFSPAAIRHLQRAAAAGIGGRRRPEFGFRSAPGLRFRISLTEGGLLLIRPRQAPAERRGLRPGIDALTGLPDRRAFLGRLGTALSEQHAGAGFAVLTFDLCGFRAVNDALGHRVGDRLLRSCAARLRDGVRTGDMVARIGADEFAVLQAGVIDPQRAETLVRRLLERLGAPSAAGGQMVTLGARAGYAMAPEDGDEAAQLLRHASLALAESKAEGRGGLRRFDPGMEARAQARHDMVSGLQDALARREFLLHYQPQVNLATGGLTGFEALLRWQHPLRGLVPPGAFIPLAEERGLMGPIGEWVLQAACREAATWPPALTVSVNVAAVQFEDGRLPAIVQEALQAAGLPGWRLEIEITESIVLSQAHTTRAQIDAIRGLGVRVAVDDFGTGYSSLAQLRNFPFDRLKIDRSFVRDLPEGHDATAIIRAVAELGTALGLATTAEGVENELQRDGLRAMGYTAAQGFFYGRPEPATSVPDFLERLGTARDEGLGAQTIFAKAKG